eukprot:scaffold189345_cov23-Tisochrysis_lutea.AAC.1
MCRQRSRARRSVAFIRHHLRQLRAQAPVHPGPPVRTIFDDCAAKAKGLRLWEWEWRGRAGCTCAAPSGVRCAVWFTPSSCAARWPAPVTSNVTRALQLMAKGCPLSGIGFRQGSRG